MSSLRSDPDHIHIDDLGEVVGTFYPNGTVDGLPVRIWYPEDTEERACAEIRERIAASKKYRGEHKVS